MLHITSYGDILCTYVHDQTICIWNECVCVCVVLWSDHKESQTKDVENTDFKYWQQDNIMSLSLCVLEAAKKICFNWSSTGQCQKEQSFRRIFYYFYYVFNVNRSADNNWPRMNNNNRQHEWTKPLNQSIYPARRRIDRMWAHLFRWVYCFYFVFVAACEFSLHKSAEFQEPTQWIN